jgi:transposase-like protein
MDIHKNARLTPLGREYLVRMVLGGEALSAAGEACGVSPRTAGKWMRRCREEGAARDDSIRRN